jgi:hypothetical protein
MTLPPKSHKTVEPTHTHTPNSLMFAVWVGNYMPLKHERPFRKTLRLLSLTFKMVNIDLCNISDKQN